MLSLRGDVVGTFEIGDHGSHRQYLLGEVLELERGYGVGVPSKSSSVVGLVNPDIRVFIRMTR